MIQVARIKQYRLNRTYLDSNSFKRQEMVLEDSLSVKDEWYIVGCKDGFVMWQKTPEALNLNRFMNAGGLMQSQSQSIFLISAGKSLYYLVSSIVFFISPFSSSYSHWNLWIRYLTGGSISTTCINILQLICIFIACLFSYWHWISLKFVKNSSF